MSIILMATLWTACAGGGSTTPGATAPLFSYVGPSQWEITGQAGGPFANTSADFTLQNPSSAPIEWTVAEAPGFVQLAPLGGLIPSGGSAGIHAELDTQLAQTLPAGQTGGTLRLRNLSADQEDVTIGCNVSLSAPTVRTELFPLDDFASSGPAGGPFRPATIVYSLSDTGTTTIDWHATAGDPWISVVPSSGVLAPNDSIDVTIGFDPAATSTFAPGPHSSFVDFVDASNSSMHSRTVTLDVSPDAPSDGWTVFTPSTDTRKVYVSSSTGNDSSSGLSEAHPKRTITAGKALMRNGYPDWLLLKCGDTWDEPIGNWGNSGRSATEPTLISSYGTGERPFLRTGTAEGIVTAYNTNPNYVSVVGLHFKAHLYTGTNGSPKGVNWLRHTTGFLLENCCIERYAQNIVIQGFNETNGDQPPNRHADVRIRRNVISEAYTCVNSGGAAGMSANGIYVHHCDGILIEENVFDHNGYVEGVSGSGPNWFRHNGYVQNGNTGVILRGNIVYGTDGVMMRSGGIVENNLYLQNYNAILFGLGIEPEAGGVSGVIGRNVVLDGRDYGDGTGAPLAGGLCLDMGNVTSATVQENIFAHNVNGTGPRPFQIHDAHQYNSYRVVENTTFAENIVYDWGGITFDIRTAEGGHNLQPVNVQITGNGFQNSKDSSPLVHHSVAASFAGITGANNKFHSSAPDNAWFRVNTSNLNLQGWKEQAHDTTSVARRAHFPDPGRTIGTYQVSIGGTQSLEAFMAQARLQSKANWRPQYTAAAVNTYIRAGFGM